MVGFSPLLHRGCLWDLTPDALLVPVGMAWSGSHRSSNGSTVTFISSVVPVWGTILQLWVHPLGRRIHHLGFTSTDITPPTPEEHLLIPRGMVGLSPLLHRGCQQELFRRALTPLPDPVGYSFARATVGVIQRTQSQGMRQVCYWGIPRWHTRLLTFLFTSARSPPLPIPQASVAASILEHIHAQGKTQVIV